MVTDKMLSFNVHGVLYLTDEEGLIPAERELRELANNVQLFKDEQDYLSMRERVHRNSACAFTDPQPQKAPTRASSGGPLYRPVSFSLSVPSRSFM